jgi:hypothetical protein
VCFCAGWGGSAGENCLGIGEVAQQPAGCNPRMPARLLAGDQQRQLERVRDPEPGKFLAVASPPRPERLVLVSEAPD